MDVWKDLEPLRKNRHVGVEQITFGVLWELAGGEPRELSITTKMIRRLFRRDGSSLRDHLVKLYRLDIVELVTRDKRNGTYRVVVYRPLPGHADKRPDPQKPLPGFWDDGGNGEDPKALAAGGDSNASDAAPPTPESDFLAAVREAPDDASPPGAGKSPHAGKSPRDGEIPAPGEPAGARGNPRAVVEEAWEKARNRAADPAAAAEDGGAGISPREETGAPPHAHAPGECGPQRASLPNGRNEQHGKNKKEKERKRIIPAGGAGKSPRDGEIPAPIGGDAAALAFAARQVNRPEEQKRRLVKDLARLVADPNTNPWLFGAAADLMLFHGRSSHPAADQCYRALDCFLKEIRALREIERRNGEAAKPKGKWLNKVVHDAYAVAGIPVGNRTKRKAKVPR